MDKLSTYKINESTIGKQGYMKLNDCKILFLNPQTNDYEVKSGYVEIFGRAIKATIFNESECAEYTFDHFAVSKIKIEIVTHINDELFWLYFNNIVMLSNNDLMEALNNYSIEVEDNYHSYYVHEYESELSRGKALNNSTHQYNNINNMSGIEFEFLCKKLLEKMGFETVTTKASNDGGIDLIAYNHQPIISGKYIIQCKRYTGSVGEPIIRDLYGVITSERANKGILITTGTFTSSAIKFANGKPIELIDGNKLKGLLTSYNMYGIEPTKETSEHFDNENTDFHWIYYNYPKYKKYETILKKLPSSWDTIQNVINLLFDALSAQINIKHLSPSKNEYNTALNECLKHIDKIMCQESLYCKYVAMYTKCTLLFLSGNIQESYEISKQVLDIIAQNEHNYYTEDEELTIVAIIYNHIQLCVIQNLLPEATTVIQKYQELFISRIDALNEEIANESLDWVPPDENIDDILEYIQETKEKNIDEIAALTNPLTLSSIYFHNGFLAFNNNYFSDKHLNLSIFSNSTVERIPFNIKNNIILGFENFPTWNKQYQLFER